MILLIIIYSHLYVQAIKILTDAISSLLIQLELLQRLAAFHFSFRSLEYQGLILELQSPNSFPQTLQLGVQ